MDLASNRMLRCICGDLMVGTQVDAMWVSCVLCCICYPESLMLKIFVVGYNGPWEMMDLESKDTLKGQCCYGPKDHMSQYGWT